MCDEVVLKSRVCCYVTFLFSDVCLPAVFMPTRTSHVFSPKAHSYFHPPGIVLSFSLTFFVVVLNHVVV